MTELLERLRQAHGCALADACSKEGCSLDVRCFHPPPLLIDADQLRRARACGDDGKIPDYYVVISDATPKLAVVELKSGRLDASLAADQLRGGAVEADKMLAGIHVEFFPIVLCGRGIHAAETKVLAAQKIRFRGVQHSIIKKRCGSRLRDILDEFG